MSYSPWVLSPPVTASPADFQQIEAPQQSNALPPFVKNKLLTSCLKTSANGLKVIRIEIYDADQFSSMEDSTCKCSAEICAQHVVLFINKQTREYQYYFIKATVTPSKIADTLVFKARARETFQRELIIKNPLVVEAIFQISCDKLTCPDAVTIGRQTETVITIGYSPLVIGESECFLEVTNNLVGTYIYKVILKCLPAKQKDIDIKTPIGTIMPLRLRVQNRTEAKTTFSTTLTHPSIQAEREYSLGPDEKGKFLVWFEPVDTGSQKCIVSFESPTAGDFVFNIRGVGQEPKPQGPFKILAGGYTTIKFKNIFDEARNFKISVDKEEFFYVQTPYEHIKSKRDIKVMVYLIENPPVSYKYLTGRLTIEPMEPPTTVQWTYFLQGVKT